MTSSLSGRAAADVADVVKGFVTLSDLEQGVRRGTTVLLHGREATVAVGREATVKVNTNIGISHSTPYDMEKKKLERLTALAFAPDMIMDHTIDPKQKDFWREIVNQFRGPVGTLPQYTAYSPSRGLQAKALLERIEEMLDGGVAFMTLHFTSDLDIYEVAKRTRPIPVTSRGGGLAIRDLIKRPSDDNVFKRVFGEITTLFKKYDAAISIGTTFRPADIHSALDAAHLMETERQIEVSHFLQKHGVKCIMEGVGHVPLNKISTYSDLIQAANCPFMPLGPMVTDSAIGFDHVVNAIGAATMAYQGGANIVNSVTREEHTGGVPTEDSIIEGLMSAKVAAHAANVARFKGVAKLDELTIRQRGAEVSCVVAGGLFLAEVSDPRKGCTRCDFECPIILAPAGKSA